MRAGLWVITIGTLSFLCIMVSCSAMYLKICDTLLILVVINLCL